MPVKKSGKENSGNSALQANIITEMFIKTIETNTMLTSKMDKICVDLKENTKATNTLLNHLGKVPEVLGRVGNTVNLVKWGLLPLIISLIGLVIFFAVR